MPILIVLIFSFILAVSVSFLRQRQLNYRLCGRIALAAMFLFAGVSHFVFDDGMVKMLPEFTPLINGAAVLKTEGGDNLGSF